ncbi:TIGR03943 family putative permease subunit [Herbidospora mongoliensis]|uniref:TIGR03943 family putative permease subunit n=1 Tax=Herbidospora mongoliensis TaxID=688067 RepID=UPI000B004F72|nr:TIGR03943 family protein [Herbidospora mongoliensis]
MTQSLLLILLGGAVLRITTVSSEYLNYVKPGFRFLLIAAGAVVLILGVAGLFKKEDGHRGPGVAWLLTLPVFAIFLIAPPPLGSYAARSEDAPARPAASALTAYTPLTKPVSDMTIGEFLGRAWGDSTQSMAGKQVKLTGFAVPSKKDGQWYVARMQIACCAADAVPLKVAVLGMPAPEEDQWIEVTGTWVPPKEGAPPPGTAAPEMTAVDVTEIPQPVEPYE